MKVAITVGLSSFAATSIIDAQSQGSIGMVSYAIAAENSPSTVEISGGSLQSQLKSIQQQNILNRRQLLEEQEQALLSKVVQYPEGRLISRGVVTLTSADADQYGAKSAADLDPAFNSETASLFILGVGREGPPLAAKRIPLKDLQFPLVFELRSDTDLLFPYTEDAWVKSSNAKDTIATTAIISSSSLLSQPANNERFGFGLSNPITFAGVLTRSSAAISVTGKIDSSLYTKEEIDLLAGVDREISSKLAASLASNEKSKK